MDDRDIKDYFEAIVPPQDLNEKTLKKIKERQKKIKIILCSVSYAAAAMLCILCASLMNGLSQSAPSAAPQNTASVFSEISGTDLGIMLFIILAAIITLVLVKTVRK